MSFKQATKQKLRVSTKMGNLNTEQLWDLSLEDLDELAVSLEEDYNVSNTKSFLVKRTLKDRETKLKFDIVLDILNTKVSDADKARKSLETKEFNQKIDEIIADKQEDALKNKTIEELEEMRKR